VWINEKEGFPETISNSLNLNGKGLIKLDADKLREFMKERIRGDEAHLSLIVFSQDVVPITVIEDFTINTTFREYLDNGGTILWIGDTPLYHLGNRNKLFVPEAYKNVTYFYQLGIVPIVAVPNQAVEFKPNEKTFQLKHHWTGLRPVIGDKSMTTLATSMNMVPEKTKSFVNVPKKRSIIDKIWSKISGVKSFEIDKFKVEFKDKTDEGHYASSCTNAWIKKYNEEYDKSGFIRIWDYMPRLISDSMLKDLNNIVKEQVDRLKKQEQERHKT
jgi:hypothetical protein